MALYRKYLDGVPEYLARYYWWAYLWRWGIWLFDHQPVINAILFGHYERLLQRTLARLDARPGASVLQLTCVYGKLTPALLHASNNDMHLCDIAVGQLQLARRKTEQFADRCHLSRMNVESLAYADDAFDQIIVFFLFHELPEGARHNVYGEIARVLRPGGSVLIAGYAATPRRHLLYRLLPCRWLLGRLEPFLPGFWAEDVCEELRSALGRRGKSFARAPEVEPVFAGFYRVMRLDISASTGKLSATTE